MTESLPKDEDEANRRKPKKKPVLSEEQNMKTDRVTDELGMFQAEELVGKEARLALHGDVCGHIVAVIYRITGRTYGFEWFDLETQEMKYEEANGFQLELC